MLDNTRKEVLIRIKAGWRCLGMYKDILCDNNLSLILRKRVFNQCVIPTMTYGCETWNITKFLEQKRRTDQHAMKRKMSHITLRDKIKKSVIRSKTKVKDVLMKIKEQPRTGKRRRGRQKSRWRDDITSYFGTT